MITGAQAQTYTNFIRQVQLPSSGVQFDVSVPAAGQQQSPLEINPTGARFELHTVRTSPLQSYLLDTRYVGSYVPVAEVLITTEDVNSNVPRTRADRPFTVQITTAGLREGPSDPEASKSVKLFRHTQSYGVNGDGEGLDRTQAIIAAQVSIRKNGTETLVYALNGIAGADRSKIRGEERFSVFSVADYQAPSSQLASQTVQIWPVADGAISGITDGQTIEFSTPTITLAFNDIYPNARIWAQVYPGPLRDNVVGTMVPGSWEALNYSTPKNRLFTISNWDSVITANGPWTMELLTSTPLDVNPIRLDSVPFNVDRTITFNGSVTTSE